MNPAARILKTAIRALGVGALLLGLAFWAGFARTLLPLHQALGVGMVLSLWAGALIAWRSGTRPGLAAFVFVWAAAVAVLGFQQGRLIPGPSHWIIQVAHLLSAGIAIAAGGNLMEAVGRLEAVPAGPAMVGSGAGEAREGPP